MLVIVALVAGVFAMTTRFSYKSAPRSVGPVLHKPIASIQAQERFVPLFVVVTSALAAMTRLARIVVWIVLVTKACTLRSTMFPFLLT